MQDFSFNTTPAVRVRNNGAEQLAAFLAEVPRVATGATVLFVTDSGLTKLGLPDAALQSLRSAGFKVTVFDAVEPDPKASTVEQAAAAARAAGATAVVGFGGGSSLDVAKVVALLLGSEQALDQMYGVGLARGQRLPLLLVPTTAGTGSEVTPIAILTTGAQQKKGISSALILPDMALLDGALTTSLPPAVTAATGVDAMVHAIEAYSSANANNNPISRLLAVQALQLLGANIRQAVFEGSDTAARGQMLLGSMLAGQAFANSPVAAVHALAYPVGSLFHVPHGLSNALVLPAVMRFNATACATTYAELAPHVFPDSASTGTEQKRCHAFIDRLAALNEELGLAPGLRSVGIDESHVDKLASEAMKQTRLLVNNPRPLTGNDAQQIYSDSL